MPTVTDRVRIRNAANTADLVTLTMGDLSALLSGDGAELDAVTGEVRSGSYTVRVVDADGGSGLRTLTRWLADGDGRWQLLSRRAVCERSIDGGAFAILLAGYVVDVRFVSAIEAELVIGDRLRVPQTARAFGAAPGFTGIRGCLIGGPVTATWGPLTYRGGWTYTVLGGTGLSRQIVVEMRDSYGPPDFNWQRGSRQWLEKVNELAQPVLAGGRRGTGLEAGFLYVDDLLARLLEDGTSTTYTATCVGSVGDGLTTRGTLSLLTATQSAGGRARLTLVVDGTGSLPATGSTGRIDVTTRAPTEACPLYVDERPFAFALALLQGVGVPVDTAAFAAADDAVGAVRLALRVTDNPTIADLIQRSVLQPFGYVLTTDAQGRLAPVRARLALGDVTPVATLTAADVAEIPTLWQLEEATAVAGYVWTMPEYVAGDAEVGMDGIRTVERRQEFAVGDLSTYATRTVEIASLGMIRQATTWAGAIEQLSSRERATLAQRYARGAPRTELVLVRGTTATDALTLGSVVVLNLPWHPNRDRRHGEGSYAARLAQVMRITEGVATRTVLLEDLGPNATALTTLPTVSIAAGAGNGRLEADITITDAATLNAAGLGLELQVAVTSGGAPAAADWVRVASWLDGAIATGVAHRVRLVVPGQTVYARARSLRRDRVPSAWTTAVSVALATLPAPTSVTATAVTGDGSRLALAWTRTTTDGAALEVRVRQAADAAGTVRWADTLPPQSTQVTVEGLVANVSHVAEVRAVQTVSGEASAWVSATATTDSTAGTPATIAAVVSSSSGRGTIGARAVLTGTPLADAVDVRLATSTDGGTTFSAFTIVATVTPDPTALDAQWSRSGLPADGTLYRMEMRQVRGGVAGAWTQHDEDVNAWIRKIPNV